MKSSLSKRQSVCHPAWALTIALLSCASATAQNFPQLPGGSAKGAGAITVDGSSRLNLAEGRIASLEKKIAEIESALGRAQAQLAKHAEDGEQAKLSLKALKNHSHDVTIYTFDYSAAVVKDVYNKEKTVVVPGPSYANPKGVTGAPKAAPGSF
jgi:uncharacterized coiled-coil protein SlyX